MAVAFDAGKEASISVSSANPVTWSHTCGSGSNGYLLVRLFAKAAPTGLNAGATYAGAAMALLGQNNFSNGTVSETVYGIANPASGANTVSVTNASSVSVWGVSQSFSGVVGAVTLGSAIANSTGNNSGTVTTVAGDMVAHACICAAKVTATYNGTSEVNDSTGTGATAHTVMAGHIAAVGASTTSTWTFTSTSGSTGYAVNLGGTAAVAIHALPTVVIQAVQRSATR